MSNEDINSSQKAVKFPVGTKRGKGKSLNQIIHLTHSINRGVRINNYIDLSQIFKKPTRVKGGLIYSNINNNSSMHGPVTISAELTWTNQR